MAAKRRLHGEGTFRQRSDGTWEARLSLEGGRRMSFYGKTQGEAAQKLRDAKKRAEQGIDLSADKLTVEQYLERWLRDAVKPSVKAKTYEGYESICRVRVAPRIGTRKLAKLTALDLQGLYTELKDAGLSPRSVQHTHRVLHRAFEQALRWNLIMRNPCDGAQAPRAERAEMKVWTPEQAAAFQVATSTHRMRALYVLALSTGMRQGELLGLKWGDLDLGAGTLSVQRSLQWQREGKYQFVDPKTSRSRRRIHLSKAAVATLRAHKDRQAFTKRDAGEHWQEQDLVFCDELGGPLAPSHQTATFKMAAAAAKLPVIRFHDMRHTAATILLAKGVHVKLVSEMLGHSTIVLTLDTYSHLIPAMHGDAAAAMDTVFLMAQSG
ncbi:MAG: site-specific integrase [Thermomicrobiales bacterium]|nr:site-specific integrase [Thermomicrobiales bacterium]